MTVVQAFADGIRRVGRAPAVFLGVWLLTLAASLPLALVMRGLLAAQLGNSLEAETAATGLSYDWMQEFGAQATGLGRTFTPALVGFGGTLSNLSGFMDAVHQPIVIVSAAAAYAAMWLFLTGGIIDRYARNRATRAAGFFSATGVFFFRFLRLAVCMGAAYGFLFGVLHPWLFGRMYARLTRDVPLERTAFLIRVSLYAIFGALVGGCNLVFDYAKVRAVVEDRRSMIGAIGAAVSFIRRAPAALALYLLDLTLLLLLMAGYAVVAPGAGSGFGSLWLGFVIGQAYVAARLWLKLVFWASEAALFQGRLAHAGYVAAPVATWPESPAAEAFRS